MKVRVVRLLEKRTEDEFVEARINESDKLEYSKKTIELSSLVNVGSEEQKMKPGTSNITREALTGDYYREAIGMALIKGHYLKKHIPYVHAEPPIFRWKGDIRAWELRGTVTMYCLKNPKKKFVLK